MPNHGDRSFDFRRWRSGKWSRPVVRGDCGLYDYHTFQYEGEPMDPMTPLLYLIQCINDSLLEGLNHSKNHCIQWINSMASIQWNHFNGITESLHSAAMVNANFKAIDLYETVSWIAL